MIMYLDKENFEAWMERIMGRFDHTDKALEKLNKRENMLEGERLYDNQDICQLLNISKRTLQRYRSSEELPFHSIYHKTYYKESDVHTFIRTHFDRQDEAKRNRKINVDTDNELE
jgi:hypothetical protein